MQLTLSNLFMLLNAGLQASDKFLRERLDPANQAEPGDVCLEETRVEILKEATEWLEDQDPKTSNILWITGAPGTGKSTIATTLAKKFEPTCASFFCKRDAPDLRNPRRIWRSLAYSLADKHSRVTARLMSEVKGRDPKYSSAIDQFTNLIKVPLETVTVPKGASYPVFLIDALDECDLENIDNWNSFLDSLKCWSNLPSIFKLIVTSRYLPDIRTKLGAVSHRIDLTVGDDVSEDSKSDIGVFFTKKFGEISSRSSSLSNWPKKEVIEEMTDCAAGLFIWAYMVVTYIGRRTADDPADRLRVVLNDIKTQSGIERGDQVDHLYARIIFETFRDSENRKKAKSILAAVSLAKEPLWKDDLITLLSIDTSDSSTGRMIEFTLGLLSPIINDEHRVRVRHKTVSDFLSSHKRSSTALKQFVTEDWELPSYLIDTREENGGLAFACIRLARRIFANPKDLDRVVEFLKRSAGSLDYALQHWFEHLEGSGGSQVPNLRCLDDAMKLAYGCLRRYASQMMLAKEEAVALTQSLRDAADFANRCINQGNLSRSSWK